MGSAFRPRAEEGIGRSRSLLGRADAIITAFDEDHVSLTLMGLVARTGLPKTTVHRTVKKMVELRWIECHEGRYGIGTRLFARAALAGGQARLRVTALPVLQQLRAATQETVHLAVIDGNEIVVIERLAGRRPIVAFSRVGGRVPALSTALGKVLAAFAVEDDREQIIDRGLEARTPNTLTRPSRIRQELAEVRMRRVGYDREECALGVGCVAAPVTAVDGSCVGAMSITGPSTPADLLGLTPAVRAAARSVSRALAVAATV